MNGQQALIIAKSYFPNSLWNERKKILAIEYKRNNLYYSQWLVHYSHCSKKYRIRYMDKVTWQWALVEDVKEEVWIETLKHLKEVIL